MHVALNLKELETGDSNWLDWHPNLTLNIFHPLSTTQGLLLTKCTRFKYSTRLLQQNLDFTIKNKRTGATNPV